jgi:hypothetical protein
MIGDVIELLGPDEDEHPRLAPGSLSDFERQVRGDARLNASARVIWLLAALSGAGPATMSGSNMAKQVGCTTETVRAAIGRAVDAGLFERRRKPGRSRTPSYVRGRVPPGFAQKGEPRGAAFRKWVRAQKWIDLKVRLAWLLIDICSANGVAETSLAALAKELGIPRRRQHVHRAAGELVGMGLFNVEPGDSRHRSRYRPNATFRYDPGITETTLPASPSESLANFIRRRVG